ncbi:hypothetical protein PROFUN_05962 [Planoprotostelium fungivorum]|uniref:Uncharacterized protein n=1 Tax=Planoprotostelium fungivorum TaxID=1890364 RepID=A0A2P6NP88_9EUKA|nr:hypothetical protein PROFUN_05962 [Planoprotostelium fungivorum]
MCAEMATPRPRDDSYFRTITTIDALSNALAADVRRLTDQEASGPAKAATFYWIETATDRQLDGWLTFSNQAFIDSVKAKGPAVPAYSREQPQFGILPLLAQEDRLMAQLFQCTAAYIWPYWDQCIYNQNPSCCWRCHWTPWLDL